MAKDKVMIPPSGFSSVAPITEDRLSQLRTLIERVGPIEHGGGVIFGLEHVVDLARRCLALEAGLRGDPGHDATAAVVRPCGDRTKAVWNWERIGRAYLAATGPFRNGVCRVCGCTRITACDVPTDYGSSACAWVPETGETLCTAPDCVAAARVVGIMAERGESGGHIPLPPEIEGKAGTFRVSGSNGLEGVAAGVVVGAFDESAAEGEVVSATLGHDPHYGHGCDEFPGLSPRDAAR